MNLEELKETDIWQLYDKGVRYLQMKNVFADTDLNYRMYNGNQWEGAKIDGIENAQYNFIETIVNYKVSVINNNLYAMHFSSENFENKNFRKVAERVCDLLNKKASRVWEKDQMDYKIRVVSEDAAINDEGLIYVYYDDESQSPVNEILNKNNVIYGNEQSADIQSQPYIIINQRKSVIEVQNILRDENISEDIIKNVKSDSDTFEQAGKDAKIEKDDMCTLLTKLWKEQDGTVWYSIATKFVEVKKPTSSGMSKYPLAHMLWKDKKGSSRGEGEVRTLIPNQLELNKTLARMLLTVKQCAYTQKVANVSKIQNPEAISQLGGVIKVKGGQTVDDVNKIFTYIQPASMSTDVSKLMSDLISITRELKNASEIATGGINPEQASGRSILAVQQASQQPLTKQSISLKMFIEDLAHIWLDMWTVYTSEGMYLEEELIDPRTRETRIQLVKIQSSILENLKATVKIDITPKSPFDKYAQELSLENLLKGGYFSAQRVSELKLYAEALPDDATMPKQKILDICAKIEEEQQRIAAMNAEAQLMQQRANQFLTEDPDAQASQLMEAEHQMSQMQEPNEEKMTDDSVEEDVDDNPDDN